MPHDQKVSTCFARIIGYPSVLPIWEHIRTIQVYIGITFNDIPLIYTSFLTFKRLFIPSFKFVANHMSPPPPHPMWELELTTLLFWLDKMRITNNRFFFIKTLARHVFQLKWIFSIKWTNVWLCLWYPKNYFRRHIMFFM